MVVTKTHFHFSSNTKDAEIAQHKCIGLQEANEESRADGD